ncbi:CD99 molecule isoform X2 [Micropterus salmoides]|uniref:CD99 molecule isoform X2 n=1 Tax=Micropterus salmoides TaxID=27706 RepID=UPI0018EA46AA|nr:CD99 molecule isoform X2 [Micropterus salmoides]
MRLCLSASVLLLFLVSGTLTQGFDLSDAVDDVTQKPKEITKAPEKPKADGELDLSDAFGPDEVTTKAPKKPSSGGSDGGTFDDKDLFDIGGGGDYKPDGGRSGGRAVDPGHDPQGGADQPQDPDLLWGQILKMLNANIPEEFYMWMSNFKQTLASVLERAMDLLQAAP